MSVFCRAMPDELAGSGGLQEIDVGFNALTAMPTSWVQGAKCGDGCPEYNISAAPIAYIGMDSNALAVRPSHVEFFFLELVCRNGEHMQRTTGFCSHCCHLQCYVCVWKVRRF